MLNLISILRIALRRLWSQRVLMACLGAGLIAAVALSASIPLYADAAQSRVLQAALAGKGDRRPPFAFLFRYIGAWHGAVEWDAYTPADTYLTTQAAAALDLPLTAAVRHVRTENLSLFADTGAAAAGAYDRRQPLAWASIGFISGLADHIELIEGQFPPEAGADTAVVDVLISRALAEKLGVQAGERYVLFGRTDGARVPIRVAGVWQPRNAADPFWFYEPRAFDEELLTPEATFRDRLAPTLRGEVGQAVWYLIFDGQGLRAGEVGVFLARLTALQTRLAGLLPDIGLDASPADALRGYRQTSQTLILQLTAFSLPLLGLVLYFVGLTGGMVVRRQQGEIAILRSRGASAGQVLAIYAVERLLLGLPAVSLGLLLGRGLAQLLGGVRTFLDPGLLAAGPRLPVLLSPTGAYFALAAVGAGAAAGLLPALAASRHTIITYKATQARTLRPPLWQRTFLDVILLLVPLYGYYVLQRQGALALPGLSGAGADPFSNPLLFLTPALFCFALALLCIRLYPLVMAGLAALADRLPGVAPLLALRQLARAPAQYTGPLALLILALSLATFTASMALTLDTSLLDQAYYRAGADLRLAELGESTTDAPTAGPGLGTQAAASANRADAQWLFLPVSEHLQVPGVAAAARVGNFTAMARPGDRMEVGRLLGVDRADFARVAYFRPDFAGGESLGALMNGLALAPDRLLVSRTFLARYGLGVGDRIRLTVQVADQTADAEFMVAGALDLFPTTYPTDGPVFVANLDYLFEQLGGLYPYDVWLRLAPDADPSQVITGVRELGVQVVTGQDARGLIAAEQGRPARQGVLGILSAGFVAAAGLTVLGFLLYAVTSFRQRFIELGMLRALGLSAGQMAAFLTIEQAAVVFIGGTAGTAVGLAASRLFIPFLQVGPQTPSFVVRIAWGELGGVYAVFGAMFAVAVGVLVWLLVRMRLFEAVKLGEAV